MSATSKRISITVLLVVTVFFPSLFAELSFVDDLDMYKWLSASELSLKGLFFPQASSGAYYRPLIGVSYLFDKYVWFLDTRLMHLDNLLFHLANTLLVYYLVCRLLPADERSQRNIPLVASLLFGIHPLTTESVAWISGRTDIMAGTFVLLSTICLLKFRETGNKSNLLVALLALIPGLLIKETPLAFLLGAIFILLVRNEVSPAVAPPANHSGDIIRCIFFAGAGAVLLLITYSVWPVFACAVVYFCYEAIRDRKAGKKLQTQTIFVLAGGLLLPVGLFFLIRKVVFASNISSIGRTIKLIVDDLNYACQTFFGAAGFYFRKFIYPFPLNFAIREIDPLYNVAGVVLFFLCLYAIRRRNMNGALFLAGICLFLPALPLSLGTVTWTAYAERYAYMSIMFWSMAASLWGGRVSATKGCTLSVSILVALFLLVMGVSTLKRSILWQTNLGMMKDIVKQSPAFKLIIPDYMAALMGQGDLEGAKTQYRRAQTIPGIGYMEALDVNMAVIHHMEGNNAAAEKLYNTAIEKTHGKSAVAYVAYISYLQESYAAARKVDEASAVAVGVKLIDNMEKLYQLNKDANLLYRSGQLALALGRCDDALRLFTKAKAGFPAQSDYARFSSRLADQLAAGHCSKE